MSSVGARPMGSPADPAPIRVATPVFRYALLLAWCAGLEEPRMRVVAARAGGEPEQAIERAGRAANGYLLFEFEEVRPGVLYDGFIVAGGARLPLFAAAELYRLAVPDPVYRVLPELPAERGEAA